LEAFYAFAKLGSMNHASRVLGYGGAKKHNHKAVANHIEKLQIDLGLLDGGADGLVRFGQGPGRRRSVLTVAGKALAEFIAANLNLAGRAARL